MNILFIMCDQLRWDYLSCYGHPHLDTPNIDRLAERGVRFDRAYVQSPICGPSRACAYTGRYMSSHGSTLNFAPIPVGEQFMGDHLSPLGMRTVLVGKTHLYADDEGMAQLGIDPKSKAGIRSAQGAFEPYWRDDGLHPNNERSKNVAYNQYLRAQGYEGDNPWHTNANGAIDEEGNFRSGWLLENARLPANIAEEHSETPYTTMRGMEFIEGAGEQPWCMHLSYIKPHWPYIVPPPYHNMYGTEHMLPVNRTDAERTHANPIFDAFVQTRLGRTFSAKGVRETVIPTYMGLIKQVDDQIGRLLDFLEERGDLDKTFIVFTSDHGDYLGDHWLGDKSFFHEESVRVPLLIVDPRPEADRTRGTADKRLVELIDLAPTFVEVAGGEPSYRLEGRSLLPLLRGESDVEWREYAISETDMTDREARTILELEADECWGIMVATERWKYITFRSFPPILFDLENDPQEQQDLGTDPAYEAVRTKMERHLRHWSLRQQRTMISDEQAANTVFDWAREKRGVLIGVYSADDLPEEVRKKLPFLAQS